MHFQIFKHSDRARTSFLKLKERPKPRQGRIAWYCAGLEILSLRGSWVQIPLLAYPLKVKHRTLNSRNAVLHRYL